MTKFFKKTAGNTVIEILIATVIVAVILTALAASMTQSIHNSSEAEYRQIAARLGQDVVEVFRQDKNVMPWETFNGALTDGSTRCIPTTFTTIAVTENYSSIEGCSSVATNNQNFQRSVTKNSIPGKDAFKITVTTAWNANDPVRKRTVELQQIFYKAN